MKVRKGKTAAPTKHLGKSVGASKKRNLKRIANKQVRAEAKDIINQLTPTNHEKQ